MGFPFGFPASSCKGQVDGGWLRKEGATCAGDESAQRKVGWIVLKPPLSVSTLAFRSQFRKTLHAAG